MLNSMRSIQKVLLVAGLGLLLFFSCIACKTIDASGEVSATVSTIDGGKSG